MKFLKDSWLGFQGLEVLTMLKIKCPNHQGKSHTIKLNLFLTKSSYDKGQELKLPCTIQIYSPHGIKNHEYLVLKYQDVQCDRGKTFRWY